MGDNGPYEYIAILKTLIKSITSTSDSLNRVVSVFYDNDGLERYNEKKEKTISSLKSIVDYSSQNGYIKLTNFYLQNIKQIIERNYLFNNKKMISQIGKDKIKSGNYRTKKVLKNLFFFKSFL